MNKLTYLLSIKTFLDKDNDFISVFSYLVLQCVKSEPIQMDEIAQELKERFAINMPSNFIRTCLKRLGKSNNFISSSHNKFVLTKEGQEILDKVNLQIEEVNREINFLTNNIKRFLEEKNIQADTNNILTNLIKVIENHTQNIANGFRDTPKFDSQEGDISILEKGIIHFLMQAEQSNPQAFDILRNIGQGVIISSLIEKKNLEKIDMSFSDLVIFLDTNFIFALLGLSDSETIKASKELINLIKEYPNISLKLFPFTLDEIRSFLNSAIKNHNNTYYAEDIQIGGARYILSQWNKTDIQILINDLEQKLNRDFGIVTIHDYTQKLYNEEDLSQLSDFKIDKMPTQKSIEHDVNAIRWIEKLRKKKVTSIEESKYLFLSLDNRLFRYVSRFHECSKPEVITPESLTAVLWVKKPNLSSSLPIYNIIAGCRERIAIHQDVWDTLLKNLREHTHADDLNLEQISILKTNSILESLEGLTTISNEQAKEILCKAEKEYCERESNNTNKVKLLLAENEEKDKNIKKLTSKLQQKTQEVNITSQYIEKSINKIFYIFILISLVVVTIIIKENYCYIESISLSVFTIKNPGLIESLIIGYVLVILVLLLYRIKIKKIIRKIFYPKACKLINKNNMRE